jgi:hypothetical protein
MVKNGVYGPSPKAEADEGWGKRSNHKANRGTKEEEMGGGSVPQGFCADLKAQGRTCGTFV